MHESIANKKLIGPDFKSNCNFSRIALNFTNLYIAKF